MLTVIYTYAVFPRGHQSVLKNFFFFNALRDIEQVLFPEGFTRLLLKCTEGYFNRASIASKATFFSEGYFFSPKATNAYFTKICSGIYQGTLVQSSVFDFRCFTWKVQVCTFHLKLFLTTKFCSVSPIFQLLFWPSQLSLEMCRFTCNQTITASQQLVFTLFVSSTAKNPVFSWGTLQLKTHSLKKMWLTVRQFLCYQMTQTCVVAFQLFYTCAEEVFNFTQLLKGFLTLVTRLTCRKNERWNSAV